MRKAIEAFEQDFARWDIRLPDDAVAARRSGHLTRAGWSIIYDFGRGAQGEFLDYYAALREGADPAVTDDWHVRLYDTGERVALPTVLEAYMYARDPTPVELERARRSFATVSASAASAAAPAPSPKAAEPTAAPVAKSAERAESPGAATPPEPSPLEPSPPAAADSVAVPDIGTQVGLDPTLAGFEPLPGGDVVASWMITPPYVLAVPDTAGTSTGAPEVTSSPDPAPAAETDDLIQHDPPGDAASFALTDTGASGLDAGPNEVTLRDSAAVPIRDFSAPDEEPGEELRDGLLLFYPPPDAEPGAPIESAMGDEYFGEPAAAGDASKQQGDSAAAEAVESGPPKTEPPPATESLADSDGPRETPPVHADLAKVADSSEAATPSADVADALESTIPSPPPRSAAGDRAPDASGRSVRPPGSGASRSGGAARPFRVPAPSPEDVLGVVDARADLAMFRPWWYRAGSRRIALIAAAAVVVIALASMMFGRHSTSGSGHRTGTEHSPAKADSAVPTDAADASSADTARQQDSTASSPGTSSPATDRGPDPAAADSPNTPRSAPDSPTGADDAVARPAGPQSVPPIVPSGGPPARRTPPARRGASPRP